MSEAGITVRKSDQFSEWYTQVILKSELADYAPVGGCIIFREYSYAMWEKIQEYLNKRFKETGHMNAYFPMLIPEELLKKEAEHFKGFVPECAWVTIGGDKELKERLAIRPTSEVIIYSMFKKWIRGKRDLPIKLNQWCNVVRWETKATKPFLRTREFLWQEGHTAHATKEEADEEALKMLMIYKELVEDLLAIPVLVGRKTESEKFAGAFYSLALEAIMPDGKALQMGTSHNLGQNFSKAFDIKFLDERGQSSYVWTTSWGVSTRLIGALVMVHGDDKGLVLPPKVAPYQVVIVPIFYKDVERGLILNKAKEAYEALKRDDVSVILDDRLEYTPGWKFNEWELKGVPLRIEIGPRDVEKGQVTIARRDTFQRVEVKESDLVKKVLEILEDIQMNLFKRAKKSLDDHITTVSTYEEFKEVLENKGGFIRACWCLNAECERIIKEETGATIRIVPLDKEEPFTNCIYCEGEAKEVVYFARAY